MSSMQNKISKTLVMAATFVALSVVNGLPQEGQRCQSQQLSVPLLLPPPPPPPLLLRIRWRSTLASPSSSTGAPERYLRHHRRHWRCKPQRHPDRLALQLHEFPSHRKG